MSGIFESRLARILQSDFSEADLFIFQMVNSKPTESDTLELDALLTAKYQKGDYFRVSDCTVLLIAVMRSLKTSVLFFC